MIEDHEIYRMRNLAAKIKRCEPLDVPPEVRELAERFVLDGER